MGGTFIPPKSAYLIRILFFMIYAEQIVTNAINNPDGTLFFDHCESDEPPDIEEPVVKRRLMPFLHKGKLSLPKRK